MGDLQERTELSSSPAADRARHPPDRVPRGDRQTGGAQPRWAAGIVSSSPRMIEVLNLIDKVARTDATVLLVGETGTGKSLLARTVHERSCRARRPLREVHC